MEQILAERLKARFAALKTNATQAALQAGLGKTAVRDIIAGKTKSPTMDTLARLANVLGCSVAYLIGDTDDPLSSPDAGNPLLDARMAPIEAELNAGWFEESSMARWNILLNPQDDPRQPQYLLYDHPMFSTHVYKLFAIGDDSNSALGIRAGDLATAVMPLEGPLQVEDDMLVVCRRKMRGRDLVEYSLRSVTRSPEAIEFKLCPSSGAYTPIVIYNAENSSTEKAFTDNQGDTITILGRVVRLTRDFPLLLKP
jgi:transcriptional regulator with XRE-family HTH domain